MHTLVSFRLALDIRCYCISLAVSLRVVSYKHCTEIPSYSSMSRLQVWLLSNHNDFTHVVLSKCMLKEQHSCTYHVSVLKVLSKKPSAALCYSQSLQTPVMTSQQA